MQLEIIRADGLIKEAGFYITVLRDSDNYEVFRAVISQDEADAQAKKLSLVVGSAYRVRIETMARITAVYVSGERTALRNMEDFYSDLTEEQIASSKIKDSQTAEMI